MRRRLADLFGIPATGKVIEWTNASIFRVENGQIVDYTGVWGALEAVQQMGVPIALPADRRAAGGAARSTP